MRLETGMRAGRESLMTHGTALSTVADNLANVNTTGFKDSRVEFADLVAGGYGPIMGGPLQTGSGVRSSEIYSMHSIQGVVNPTGRSLDAAIQGRGWFMVNDGTTDFYTRAGNFTTNDDGYLVTPTGKFVLGFSEANPGLAAPIQVTGVSGNPQATTRVQASGNLNSSSANIPGAVPGAGATFEQLNQNADLRTTVQVIDSLGEVRDVTLFFHKTANQTWNVQAAVDSAEVGGMAGTPTIIGNSVLQFDENGNLTNPDQAMLQVNPAWGGGAAAGNVAINLSGFTGFSAGSSITQLNRDGIRGGNTLGVSIDQYGNVIANLDSNESVVIAELALATFSSPDALERVGTNYFRADEGVGERIVGRSNQEGFGNILGESLENSSVDPAKEFVNMIQFQQGYQAGSQVIKTLSELMSSTIQIA